MIMKKKQNHDQLPITNPSNNKVVYIDEDIAPLMYTLWKLKLETLNSCQNNNGYIWIQFKFDSFKKFINILMKNELTLMEYILTGNISDEWKYELIVSDNNEYYDKNEDTIYHPNPTAGMSVSFRFNPEFYNIILNTIKKEYRRSII